MDRHKILPITIQTLLDLIPLLGVLLFDWRLIRLLFFYFVEGIVMIIYGVVRVLVAPHKEEEDLTIPVEEGVDTKSVPQRFEKLVLVGIFLTYSLVFMSVYGIFAVVLGGLSELPYLRTNSLNIDWYLWLFIFVVWLVSQGIVFLYEVVSPEIKIQGDKHEINVILYRLVMKFVVILVFAIVVQIIFRSLRWQVITSLIRIALNISFELITPPIR